MTRWCPRIREHCAIPFTTDAERTENCCVLCIEQASRGRVTRERVAQQESRWIHPNRSDEP